MLFNIQILKKYFAWTSRLHILSSFMYVIYVVLTVQGKHTSIMYLKNGNKK